MATNPDGKHLSCWLQISEQRILGDWARSLKRMFPDNVGVYQVGSSLRRPDYRDVDVRIMMYDKAYHKIIKRINLLDLNLALSLWGQKVTGLPIDCQIQDMTETNKEHPGLNGKRKPLGMSD